MVLVQHLYYVWDHMHTIMLKKEISLKHVIFHLESLMHIHVDHTN